jgi:replicative DNA helicase
MSVNNPKIPPQSPEAECSLIGGVMIDSDALIKVVDIVRPEDFYEDKHRYIFQAIVNLYEKRKPIDLLTVSDSLQGAGLLETIGGAEYLAYLSNYVPTAANAEAYADIISTKAIRRRLIRASSEIADLSFDEQNDLKDLVEQAEAKLFEVSERHVANDLVAIESVLSDAFDRLDELHNNKDMIRGVSTGFRDLDNLLAGFQRSDLIILAARPSMGKTALALNLANNIASKGGEVVLLFSLEMSKEQLVDRLLAAESGIDAWNLRTGNLKESDFEKLSEAMGTLSEAKMLIDDSPGMTVSEMRTKARREAHKQPLGLIIVDYLQLMSGPKKYGEGGNRVQEISDISRGLKGLARELNVPVLALSQLSRSVENRSPQIPQLSDLRESGSIEQDADVVAFIYREEVYNPETERQNITDILIRKHRNGPIGKVELYFDKAKQRLRTLDKKHSGASVFDE